MKLGGPPALSSGVRIVWMLAASIFFGVGVGIVWWPTSQTIASYKTQAKSLYDDANQDETEIAHASELRSAARRVEDDVKLLSAQSSAGAVTAATLRLLNGEAHAYGVDVRSIVPAPQASASPGALAGTVVELDVRGRFRNLLAFISDLPRHDVLMEINDVSLAGTGDRSPKPVLAATIHAAIYRYRGIGKETQHASGAL
ncbi:MAG TPA: type 4a pilus biogenesis protein PilO [Candidatus Acidoferrales bacterium]|nr:type 4a pilus biogenesis protein PilO [Candidatus Acidoferrales bacterium]